MEFVILLMVLINHNDGSAALRAVPVQTMEQCEDARRAILSSIGPAPEGVEVRIRCVPTEALAPSI